MITCDNIDDIYVQLLEKIVQEGHYVSDKSGYYELLGESFKLTNPRSRIIYNPARHVDIFFMLAECIWIFSGHNELEMIASYAKKWCNFSDDGMTLHGAYGKRLRNWYGFDQISNIENLLTNKSQTRQAVLTIFNPILDLTCETKDVPCNTLLQFFVRDSKLSLIVYVRSQDMILGLPYDLFHWTILQELLAQRLNYELGDYITMYGSVHFYKHDQLKVNQIISTCSFDKCVMPKMPLSSLDDFKVLYEVEESIRKTKVKHCLNLDNWWNVWLDIFAQKWIPNCTVHIPVYFRIPKC